MLVIVSTIQFSPVNRQFIISMVVLLVILRVQYILDVEVCVQSILGFELDKSLVLRQDQPNLFAQLRNRASKYATSSVQIGPNKDSTLGDSCPDTSPDNPPPPLRQQARTVPHATEHLPAEIQRTKELLESTKAHLALLEGMLFMQNTRFSTNSESRGDRPESAKSSRIS